MTMLEALEIPLIFMLVAISMSLIGYKLKILLIPVASLIISTFALAYFIEEFTGIEYLLLIFYIPLLIIPLATYRN